MILVRINTPIKLRSSLLPSHNMMDCWLAIQSHLSQHIEGNDLIQLAAFTLWQISKIRNAMVFSRKFLQYTDTIATIINFQHEFNVAGSLDCP